MRIEGSMQSIPTQGNNAGKNATALRQQLRVLEQEHSRLSAKGQLSEAERKRKEQLEREIERLQQQIQQIEQNQKKKNPAQNEETADETYVRKSGILV